MKHVLVIDDNEDVLLSLKILLKSHDLIPSVSESPEHALELIKMQKFDLILQDMNFKLDTVSGKEGLDLLSSIKQIDKSIPVLLFTAWANIDLVVEGMRRGAADFFIKPWDND